MSLNWKTHNFNKTPKLFAKFIRLNDVANLISDQRIGDILCGFSLPNDTVIPSGPHTGVQIYFQSDSSDAYEGFAVSLSFDVDTGSATLPPGN